MISDEFKVKLCGVWVEEVGPVEGIHGGKRGREQHQGQPVDGRDDPRPVLDVVRQEENGAELNLRQVSQEAEQYSTKVMSTSSMKTKRMQETIQISRQVT